MYAMHRAIIFTDRGQKIETYQILKNNVPCFKVNCFLEKHSKLTAKQYANRLCLYFNFLEKRNKDYTHALISDVFAFINNMLFDSNGLNYISRGRVTYATISQCIIVIKTFYKFLEDDSNKNQVLLSIKEKRSAKNLYMYGQIYECDYEKFLVSKLDRVKGSKEYIKWYTEEEIEAIKSNFKNLRDEAIFLLSLEGMRIDEILSLRVADFEPTKYCVYPYRSKGKETGNVSSTVTLPMETVRVINNYIYNERDEVLIKLQEKGVYDFFDNLFLNLREDEYFGHPLSYRNVLSLLKGVAVKAGLDPKMIRTHSGRSTKTMELLHHQVEHPELNLTDEQIRQMMRWKSPSSIIPYINIKDRKISVETAKKINQISKTRKKHSIGETKDGDDEL